MFISNKLTKMLLIGAASLTMFSCVKGVQDLQATRAKNSAEDMAKAYNNVSVPSHPLSLEEIIEIALKQNLEVRLQQMELAIQKETATSEKLRMLPSLTYNNEYSYRSKNTASTSESVIDGTPASIGSISTDKTAKKYDITLAWSILDFGLSYYKAKREQNRTLLLRLQHQRLQQNLIFDIVRAYWRTIVARKAAEGAELLIELAEQTQVDLRRQVERKIVSEIEGLTNENRLIDMQIKLQVFRNEYNSAKSELAQFMGLSREHHFSLASAELMPVDGLQVGLETLESEAVNNRPELFAQDVEEKIQVDDIKAAIIQMFPNVNLFSAFNHNGDSHLLNNDWFSLGLKTSWNLLSIPSLIHEKHAIEDRQELVRRTRLQESVAILTQVNLAYINHMDTVTQYRLAKELYAVKTRLLEAAKKEQAQGVFHGADILEFEVETLFAKINTLKAYAELMIGLERLSNSVGMPLKYNVTLRNLANASMQPDGYDSYVDAENPEGDNLSELLKVSHKTFDTAETGSVISLPELGNGAANKGLPVLFRRESIQVTEDKVQS